MKKPIMRYYKAVNDSLDIMFEYEYSTMRFKREGKWLTVYLNDRGEPALFWIKQYSRHREELAAKYPEYEFEGEIDAAKYEAYKKEFKKYYPKWSDKDEDKGDEFKFLRRQ